MLNNLGETWWDHIFHFLTFEIWDTMWASSNSRWLLPDIDFAPFKHMGVSENVVYPIVPNGFADHYPYEKWLFHWEYTLFSDKAICLSFSITVALAFSLAKRYFFGPVTVELKMHRLFAHEGLGHCRPRGAGRWELVLANLAGLCGIYVDCGGGNCDALQSVVFCPAWSFGWSTRWLWRDTFGQHLQHQSGGIFWIWDPNKKRPNGYVWKWCIPPIIAI